jgi:hypothetical protein
MRIIENKRRKDAVIGRIIQTLQRGEFPFNLEKAQPPQRPENLPPGGFASDRDKACFFFFLCFWMAGGIISDHAVRALSKLYGKAPWLFDPYQAQHADPSELEALLVSVGLTFKSQFVKDWWPENSRRLIATADGDPRRLYDGVATFEDACARIRNRKIKTKTMSPGGAPGFFGFQEKMVSMLTYYLMDAGFISAFNFPPPIDFHFLRILVSHEILRVEPRDTKNLYTPELLAKARTVLLDYSREHNIDPLLLSNAVWGFGRAMCDEHAGNGTSKSKDLRGRNTELTPIPVTWSNRQIRAYLRACAVCPVEPTCRWNIPAADYYVRGQIVLRGERDKPPLFKKL